MARKNGYRPEIANQIIQVLSAGTTIKDACAYVGISQDTYERWCKKYADFAESATRARSMGRVEAVGIIRKAIGKGDTQAAQWYLERTDPEHWGKRTYHRIEGLEELLKLCERKGVNASDLFNAMIAELAIVSANGSEAGG